MKQVVGATLLTPHRLLEGSLCWSGSRFVSPRQAAEAEETLDLTGLLVAPGFIDLHTHGGPGYTFSTADSGEIRQALARQAKSGVTGSYPTLYIPGKPESAFLPCLEALNRVWREASGGPQLLGVHLEGPYIHWEREEWPPPTFCRELLGRFPAIGKMTVAPEVPGAQEAIRLLRSAGAFASIGHTQADCGAFMRGVEWGATQVTHLYSGMEGVARREGIRYPGAVESALMTEGIFLEVIANGFHLSPDLLRFVCKLRARDVCIVTDGHYREEGGEKVLLLQAENGCSLNSAMPMDDMLRLLVKKVGIELPAAVRMMTLNPARAMGIDSFKGALAPGYDADFVALDQALEVRYVVARGEVVYDNR